MSRTYDPTLENKLTPDIIEAAQKIETWAKMNGYESWELIGICSRDHAWKLEETTRRCKMALCEGAAVAGAAVTNLRTKTGEQIKSLQNEIAKMRGIIARNALQRLAGEEATQAFFTAQDIKDSLEILYAWQEEQGK